MAGSPAGFAVVDRWKGNALDFVDRVDLCPDHITLTLQLAKFDITTRHVLPMQIKKRGVEMRLILEGKDCSPTKPDVALIKAVARANKWFDDLVSERARSLGVIAEAEGVSRPYVGHILPLAFLAPDIVEAILAGTQPADLTAETLIKNTDLPLDWREQRALLGFDA